MTLIPVPSLADLLADLEAKLHPPRENARLDAQVLLAHTLGKSRAWLVAHSDESPTTQQLEIFIRLSARLLEGEPLPYVLGHWEFYGLDFQVTPAVLIPRPETELLIEHAIGWLQRNPERRRAADIGSGSGCIAVTLAARFTDLTLTATDINLTALEVAQANARQHQVSERINFLQADLLDFPPTAPFDLLCANLPYIPRHQLPRLAVSQWEPVVALDGGPDGLDLVSRLLQQARGHLAPGGLMLLEIEASQGPAASALAANLFPEAHSLVIQDLAGHDRLLSIQLPT